MAAAVAFFVFMLQGRRGTRYAIAVVGVAMVVLGFVFNSHHDPSENFTRISIWQVGARDDRALPADRRRAVRVLDRLSASCGCPTREPTAFHAHSFLLTVAAEAGLTGVAAALFGWRRFVGRVRRAAAPHAAELDARARDRGRARRDVGPRSHRHGERRAVRIVAAVHGAGAVAGAPSADPPASAPRPLTACRARRSRPCSASSRASRLVQLGSDAVFARAAASVSVAARLPPGSARACTTTLERVAPLPFVEAMLTDDALQRGDLAAATAHAARMPAGTLRHEYDAHIALARGRHDEAVRRFLEAGDDAALQADVRALMRPAARERRTRSKNACGGGSPKPRRGQMPWPTAGGGSDGSPCACTTCRRPSATTHARTRWLRSTRSISSTPALLALQRHRADMARASSLAPRRSIPEVPTRSPGWDWRARRRRSARGRSSPLGRCA